MSFSWLGLPLAAAQGLFSAAPGLVLLSFVGIGAASFGERRLNRADEFAVGDVQELAQRVDNLVD